jgi:hypothetical protein
MHRELRKSAHSFWNFKTGCITFAIYKFCNYFECNKQTVFNTANGVVSSTTEVDVFNDNAHMCCRVSIIRHTIESCVLCMNGWGVKSWRDTNFENIVFFMDLDNFCVL